MSELLINNTFEQAVMLNRDLKEKLRLLEAVYNQGNQPAGLDANVSRLSEGNALRMGNEPNSNMMNHSMSMFNRGTQSFCEPNSRPQPYGAFAEFEQPQPYGAFAQFEQAPIPAPPGLDRSLVNLHDLPYELRIQVEKHLSHGSAHKGPCHSEECIHRRQPCSRHPGGDKRCCHHHNNRSSLRHCRH